MLVTLKCPPRELLTGLKCDYTRLLRAGFGDYAQVTEYETDNTMSPRTFGAIALLPTGNEQRSVKFLKLSTLKVITSARYKVLPTPNEVISFMNDLAIREPPSAGAHRDMFDEDADDVNHSDNIEVTIDITDVDEPPLDAVNQPVSDNDVPDLMEESDDDDDDNVDIDDEESVVTADGVDAVNDTPADRNDDSKSDHDDGDDIDQLMLFNVTATTVEAETAVEEELTSIHDKDTLDPVVVATLTPKELSAIIPSCMLVKPKYNAQGEYEKHKARLVGRGDFQDPNMYEVYEKSSPTMSSTALFTICGIAASKDFYVATMDVGTAYLNAKIDGNEKVLMKIPYKYGKLLMNKYPLIYTKESCLPDGSLVVRLKRALYGLIQSSRLWHNEISSTLEKLGYIRNTYESCIFVKTNETGQVIGSSNWYHRLICR